MAHRHSFRTVFRSPLLSLRDFRCWEDDRAFGDEETTESDEIVFVRRGAYERCISGRTAVLDAGSVVFHRAGVAYRVRHPVPGGDACTTLSLRPDVLRELATGGDPTRASPAEEHGHPIPWDELPCPSRAFLLQHEMIRHAASPERDPLAMEEAGLGLAELVLTEGRRRYMTGLSTASATTARRHRDLVEDAKRFLAARWSEPLCLDDVASAVHASPFHLTRLFHRHAGAPVHRHLKGIRLRASLERLAEGERDLSRLAHELGFAGHGHFTAAFRHEFGETPSSFRRGASVGRLARLSKNLKA